jgi:hypothetical protein
MPVMNCLFYSRIKDGAGERLLKVVEQVFPEEKREIFRKIDCLSNRLRQPRDNNLTIAKGHTLRPRFLTYADSDFAEVVAVLSKMFENTNLSKEDKKRR